MQYMMIWKPGSESTTPPSQREMEEMGKFIQETAQAGVLIATGGLQHSSKGARVRISGQKFIVTDGPFTEAKELVGGYAIIEVKSKEEAIEQAKRFLEVAGKGETEIRPLHSAPIPAKA